MTLCKIIFIASLHGPESATNPDPQVLIPILIVILILIPILMILIPVLILSISIPNLILILMTTLFMYKKAFQRVFRSPATVHAARDVDVVEVEPEDQVRETREHRLKRVADDEEGFGQELRKGA